MAFNPPLHHLSADVGPPGQGNVPRFPTEQKHKGLNGERTHEWAVRAADVLLSNTRNTSLQPPRDLDQGQIAHLIDNQPWTGQNNRPNQKMRWVANAISRLFRLPEPPDPLTWEDFITGYVNPFFDSMARQREPVKGGGRGNDKGRSGGDSHRGRSSHQRGDPSMNVYEQRMDRKKRDEFFKSANAYLLRVAKEQFDDAQRKTLEIYMAGVIKNPKLGQTVLTTEGVKDAQAVWNKMVGAYIGDSGRLHGWMGTFEKSKRERSLQEISWAKEQFEKANAYATLFLV